ncbi:MAG: peptidylprolyl isomerase [Ilumatobacteraceae bacterium]
MMPAIDAASLSPSTGPTVRSRGHRAVAAFAVFALAGLAACGDAEQAVTPGGSSAGTAALAQLPDGCAAADGSSATQQQFDAYPPMCLVEGAAYTAIIETNQGTLRVTLRPEIAPLTVNSFVNLARFHYFDGTTCHRAIQQFVVQCGDPTATGTGGPGYEFPDELAGFDGYAIGSVAMANAGPNTNGSQFFIITGPNGAALPPNYTLFGQVLADDLPLVATLDSLSNPADGPPLEPIDIVSVTIEQG